MGTGIQDLAQGLWWVLGLVLIPASVAWGLVGWFTGDYRVREEDLHADD